MSRQRELERLPEALRWRADVAGNGELLWPGAAALEAIDWMEQSGLGVLGFEVYGRLMQARGHFQHEWAVEPGWRRDEPWTGYVARAAADARREVAADARRRRQPGVPGEVRDRRYFIAVATGDSYPESLRART